MRNEGTPDDQEYEIRYAEPAVSLHITTWALSKAPPKARSGENKTAEQVIAEARIKRIEESREPSRPSIALADLIRESRDERDEEISKYVGKKPRQGWAEAAERLAKEAKEDLSKRKAEKEALYWFSITYPFILPFFPNDCRL